MEISDIQKTLEQDINNSIKDNEIKKHLLSMVYDINAEMVLLLSLFMKQNIPLWKSLWYAYYYSKLGEKFDMPGLEWIETYLPSEKRIMLIGR